MAGIDDSAIDYPADKPDFDRVFVPGSWACPKCKFTLGQMTLSAQTGELGARDKPGEPCPNCGTPLWRRTWRQEAEDALAMATNLLTENRTLTDNLAEAREHAKDVESTLDAWFDTKSITRDQIGPKMMDAAKGYLRTSRVGGMSQEESDTVEGVIADMIRLDYLTAPVTQYLMTQDVDVQAMCARLRGQEAIPSREDVARFIEALALRSKPTEPVPVPVSGSDTELPGEPMAVAYDFDGHGWRYIDAGSGSDWFKRGTAHDDHIVLYHPRRDAPSVPVSSKEDEYHRMANALADWAGRVTELVQAMDLEDRLDREDTNDATLIELAYLYDNGGVRALMTAPGAQEPE